MGERFDCGCVDGANYFMPCAKHKKPEPMKSRPSVGIKLPFTIDTGDDRRVSFLTGDVVDWHGERWEIIGRLGAAYPDEECICLRRCGTADTRFVHWSKVPR